jgi:molybdopterin molybdotransferase
MISVDEAQAIIAGKTSPLDSERMPLNESLARVLRESIAADADQPPFDRSAMDGYAIRADDSSGNFKIMGIIQAGDVPAFPLQPGECARIFTGAQIPQNTGAVVRQEDAIVEGKSMRIAVRSREPHIRKRGEDVRAGSELLSPGHLLSPVDLSVMAGTGHTRVLVSRKPRVLHLGSGNELVAPDQAPGPGRIRDTNSVLIQSLVEQAGGEVVGQLHLGDDLEEIVAAARNFARPYDILLFSGGASVGDFDFAGTTLERLGFDIHFRQVNVRPGKPLIFATRDRRIAFGLPGNPVSHFVTFHLFVRPALRAMLGLTQVGMEFVGAHLWHDYDEPPNPRETYAPAQWFCADGIKNHVKPIAWRSSGHLASLIPATGLLRIPANSPPMKKGELVQVFPV